MARRQTCPGVGPSTYHGQQLTDRMRRQTHSESTREGQSFAAGPTSGVQFQRSARSRMRGVRLQSQVAPLQFCLPGVREAGRPDGVPGCVPLHELVGYSMGPSRAYGLGLVVSRLGGRAHILHGESQLLWRPQIKRAVVALRGCDGRFGVDHRVGCRDMFQSRHCYSVAWKTACNRGGRRAHRGCFLPAGSELRCVHFLWARSSFIHHLHVRRALCRVRTTPGVGGRMAPPSARHPPSTGMAHTASSDRDGNYLRMASDRRRDQHSSQPPYL